MMASASAMAYPSSTPTQAVSSGDSGELSTSSSSMANLNPSNDDQLLSNHLDMSHSILPKPNVKTNGTHGGNTGIKRSLSDSGCSLSHLQIDTESPKKRRKQSTPVKISSTCQADVANVPDVPDLNSEQRSPSPEGKRESHITSSPVPSSATPSPELFPTSKLSNELPGSDLSPSPASHILPSNISNMHPDLFKMDLSAIGAPWINDIQNKAEDWLSANPMANVPFSFPPLQSPGISNQMSPFPMLESNQQPGHLLSRPMNQPRIRIFNPDAYCDLCNKEFCNKYFLKTHKANKHGIYTDLPTSELNIVATSTSSREKTSSAPNSSVMETLIPNPIQPQPQQQQQPLQQLQLQPQQIVCQNSIQTTQTQPLAVTPIKSQDPIATKLVSTMTTVPCDICQKKFANKSILKRHKSKVHGIVDETDIENDSNIDQNISDSNSETTTPQINTSPSTIYYQDSLPDCLKPFLDPEFDSDNLQYRLPITSVQSPSTSINMTTNSSQTPIREAIHRPRGLGIVNPEAFCEICCKEYCNKYFLRTHKMKRHGIIMPDDTPKEANIPPRTMQTSPLNLIMSEQTNSSESYGEKKDAQSSTIDTCPLCSVQVSQCYMKSHFEACHSDKNLPGNNPGQSTSSPLSTNQDEDLSNTENTEKSSEENISEDLKKLQTMILQLNNLNVCQIVSCNVCGKDFENKFYLQAHMMSEHGALYMKITDDKLGIQTTPNPQDTPGSTPTTESVLVKTEKLYGSETLDSQKPALSQPLAVSLPESLSITPKPNLSSNTSNPERRTSMSMAPTNSYCEICNKELCNKYFMKTHMQRMHGIEIENGAQIGGVVCNICNKELCSKYFLRVHKHNTHGIVEDGVILPQGSRQSSDDNTQIPTSNYLPHSYNSSDSALKPNELTDLNHRYFAHFTEVCPICNRRFRSTKWLKAHILTDHGKAEHDKWEDLEQLYQSKQNKMAESMLNKENDNNSNNPTKVPNGGQDEQDPQRIGIQNLLTNIFGPDESHSRKYYCSYCNFSTPVLAFLFVHERSHGQVPPYNKNDDIVQCPICMQSFSTPESLQQHLMVQHANIAQKQFYKLSESKESQAAARVSPSSEPDQDDKPLEPSSVQKTNGSNRELVPSKKDELRPIQSSDFAHIQLPTSYALPQLHPQNTVSQLPVPVPIEASENDRDREHDLDNDPPHDHNSTIPTTKDQTNDKFIMQAFLIEECIKSETTSSMGVQLRLVPTLVFLPVREKVTTPLTTSIKLTPT